jgi:polyisoprenoid-binding protein YceI
VFAVTVNLVGLHPMRKTPMAGFDAVATIKRSEFGVNRMAGAVPGRSAAAHQHGSGRAQGRRGAAARPGAEEGLK